MQLSWGPGGGVPLGVDNYALTTPCFYLHLGVPAAAD